MTHPARRRLADCLVLVALAAFALWYLFDTFQASSRVTNLIFILPVGVALLALCALEAVRLLRAPVAEEEPTEEPENIVATGKVIALFSAYVLSAEPIGFDLATCLFVALYLLMKGERRYGIVAAYALLFGNLVPLFFARMLPYPMPMAWL